MEAKLRVAAKRFVRDFGGGTEISGRLNAAIINEGGKPITPQAVRNWAIKGKIPHKRLALIEQVYGVKPGMLRPDRVWVKPTNKEV